MKNYIATCVIAAASLASCTQTEDFTSQYDEQAKTMKFDVAYVGKNTRTTGNMTTDKLNNKTITIWGAAYPTSDVSSGGLWITETEPLTLTKSSSTSYWYAMVDNKDTEVKYPGSTYKTYFTAIAPADEFEAVPAEGISATKATYSMAGQYTDGTEAPSSTTRRLTLANIPVVQEAPSTLESSDEKGSDYLVACATSTTEEVSLQFKHLLSRLKFAVWTDEKTMANAGNETTKIELNKIVFYLPGNAAKAQYVQTNHNEVAGTWTWSGFTNITTVPNTTTSGDYQAVTLISSGTKDVKYYNGPTAAHAASWDNVKLTDEDKTFFIAPNGNTTCKLYMDIEYTVRRKLSNGGWSSSSTEGETGYSAGHKVVKRTGMAVPIGDSSLGHGTNDTDDNADRNEGLSHFHQGYTEILYICLRADQLVKFDTTFNVDGWQEDPIDTSKNQ